MLAMRFGHNMVRAHPTTNLMTKLCASVSNVMIGFWQISGIVILRPTILFLWAVLLQITIKRNMN